VDIAIALVVIAIIVATLVAARAARRKRLLEKYHDEALVNRLIRHVVWQGETEEQLLDSMDRPGGIDSKTLKTKTRVVWKYNRTGTNRYSLRITLEDGVVVGWDSKG